MLKNKCFCGKHHTTDTHWRNILKHLKKCDEVILSADKLIKELNEKS